LGDVPNLGGIPPILAALQEIVAAGAAREGAPAPWWAQDDAAYTAPWWACAAHHGVPGSALASAALSATTALISFDFTLPAHAACSPTVELAFKPLRLALSPEVLETAPRHAEAWAAAPFAPPPALPPAPTAAAPTAAAPLAECAASPEEGDCVGDRVRAQLLARPDGHVPKMAPPPPSDTKSPETAPPKPPKPPLNVRVTLPPSDLWLLLPRESEGAAERLGLRVQLAANVDKQHSDPAAEPDGAISGVDRSAEMSVKIEATVRHLGSDLISLTWPPAAAADGRAAVLALGAPLLEQLTVHVSTEGGGCAWGR